MFSLLCHSLTDRGACFFVGCSTCDRSGLGVASGAVPRGDQRICKGVHLPLWRSPGSRELPPSAAQSGLRHAEEVQRSRCWGMHTCVTFQTVEVMSRVDSLLWADGRIALRLLNWWRASTRTGSRRVLHAHRLLQNTCTRCTRTELLMHIPASLTSDRDSCPFCLYHPVLLHFITIRAVGVGGV